MSGVGTEIAIALIFWAICAVCALCIAANIIARICRKSPTEDEGDDLANGDVPHLAPDVLTSFHSSTVPQTEEPGRV